MHKLVMRFTIAIGAIVAAACVYDAPVTPSDNAVAVSSSPSMQIAAAPAPTSAKSYLINFTGTTLPADVGAQVGRASCRERV